MSTTIDPELQSAITKQVHWKSAEYFDYACRLLMAALAKLDTGADRFSAADCDPPASSGIAGAVFKSLCALDIIQPVLLSVVSGLVMSAVQERVKNPNRKAYVGVYRLRSRSLAEAFLRRHQQTVEPKQTAFL